MESFTIYGLIIAATILFLLTFFRKRVISIDTKHSKGKKLLNEKYGIVAIPDLIEQAGGSTLIVREMKSRGTQAYPSDIIQLKATILCVMAHYPHKKIIGIVEISGNREAYREAFSRKSEHEIYKSIETHIKTMRSIKGGKKPKQPKKSGKCHRCAYREECFKGK